VLRVTHTHNDAAATALVYVLQNSWSQGWGGLNAAPYKGYAFVRKDCAGTGAFSMYQYNPIVPIAG